MNQLKNKTFPEKIDWISPEIFFSEKSEVDLLREELENTKRMYDQLKNSL